MYAPKCLYLLTILKFQEMLTEKMEEFYVNQDYALLYGCGSERSEYGNPAVWLVHERSDISRIARTRRGEDLRKLC